MIKKISCAGLLITTSEGKILLEDRRKIKKHGEHWSFFGGTIEKGESRSKALHREIKEELGIDIVRPSFFKTYNFSVKDIDLTYHMYHKELRDLSKLRPHKKADMKLFTLKQALRLKVTDIDKKIIRDLKKFLEKNR